MAIIYPVLTNGLQKTLDANLLTGVTASATFNNVTGIQNKLGLFVIDRVDGNNNLTPNKREYISFAGTSGSTVITLTRGLGGSTDQDHAVGAIVEFVSDVVQQQAIIDYVEALNTTVAALPTASSTTTFTNKTLTSPKLNEDVALTATATQLNALVGAGGSDGWTSASETWTYASASTITVPSGAAAKYAIGDRIRWKQGAGYKYGVLTTVADTLLTIAINTDFTVATPTAITDNYYSHQISPIGFPQWFNLVAPTFNITTSEGMDNGSGGQPTTTEHRLCINGRTASVHYKGNGTKVGTDTVISVTASTMPLPVNTTTTSVIGFVWAAGAEKLGSFIYTATNPFACVFVASITDNTTITSLSYDLTYEI